MNKELIGFTELKYSSPWSLNLPIELAFEPNEKAVVDVEFYFISRIAGYHDRCCS
jgi:hypothetical protein